MAAPKRTDLEGVPASDVVTKTWTWWPEDTLDVIDMLLVYSGFHDKLRRPQVECKPPLKLSKKTYKGRRCIHPVAIQSATALVHFFHGTGEFGQAVWFTYEGTDMAARLRAIGINPDTVQVQDKERWAIAWWQLTHDNRYKFLMETQENLVSKGFKAPNPEPRTTTKMYAKKKKTVAQKENKPAQDFENEPAEDSIGAMLKAQHGRSDIVRM